MEDTENVQKYKQAVRYSSDRVFFLSAPSPPACFLHSKTFVENAIYSETMNGFDMGNEILLAGLTDIFRSMEGLEMSWAKKLCC